MPNAPLSKTSAGAHLNARFHWLIVCWGKIWLSNVAHHVVLPGGDTYGYVQHRWPRCQNAGLSNQRVEGFPEGPLKGPDKSGGPKTWMSRKRQRGPLKNTK